MPEMWKHRARKLQLDVKCLNCKGKEIRTIMSRENITYKNALQMYLLERRQKENKEVEEEFTSVPSYSGEVESYSSILRKGKSVICKEKEKEDDILKPAENEMEQQEWNGKKMKAQHKKTKRGEDTSRKQEETVWDSVNTQEHDSEKDKEGNDKKNFNLKRLFSRIKAVILSRSSLEEKIFSTVKIVCDECKMFVMNLFSDGKVVNTIIGSLCNKYG